jgi:hypothetical protein
MTQPQFSARTCRPRDHLAMAGRLYADAWRQADTMRAGRGKGLPDWPDWCYLPIAGTQAIVAEDARIPVEELHLRYPERLPDAARLAGLAA